MSNQESVWLTSQLDIGQFRDILWINKLWITYDEDAVKNLSEDELKSLKEDILAEEPEKQSSDLWERIIKILSQIYKVSSQENANRSTTETSKDWSSKLTNLWYSKEEENSRLDMEIWRANESVKNLSPGLIENLVSQTKPEDLSPLGQDKIAKIQGVTPDKIDLKDPKIQWVLEALVIDRNKDQIRDAAIKNGKSDSEVQETFTRWWLKMNELNIPVTGSIDAVLKWIPKKISDPVRSAYELVSDGQKPTITRTGNKLNFSDPKSGKFQYEIDMGEYPPRLSKKLNGLSIKQSLPSENPERQWLQSDLDQTRSTLESQKMDARKDLDRAGLYGFNLDQYSPEEVKTLLSGKDFSDIYRRVVAAKTPEEYSTLREELRKERDSTEGGTLQKVWLQYMEYIIDEKTELTNIWSSGATSIEVTDWIEKIEAINTIKRDGKLEKYANEKERYEKMRERLWLIKDPTVEGFDQIATKNLEFLSDNGYDILGQGKLDDVVREINMAYGKINGQDFIDPSFNRELDDEQKRVLFDTIVNITRNGYPGDVEKREESVRWMNDWKWIDSTDRTLVYRQTQQPEWRKAINDLWGEFRPPGKYATPEWLREVVRKGTKPTNGTNLAEAPSVNA